MLLVIQSQLLSIDPKFWIMIDYNDLISRARLYVPIVSKFLQMNQNVVKNAFNKVIESQDLQRAREEYDYTNKKLKRMIVINNSFYKEYNKWQWPVFNSDYFLVTPEDTQFLDSKYQ